MQFRSYEEALADLKDEAAARRVADLGAYLREGGWQYQEWLAQVGEPGVTRSGTGLRYAPWMDHLYKLITPQREQVFVAEPYEVSGAGLANLARLARQGWRISVRPDLALHYPGRTVAVWVWRQEEAKVPFLEHRWLNTPLTDEIQEWLQGQRSNG